MNRKMFILNSNDGAVGFARLKESGEKIELTLELKSSFEKNCTPYLLCENGEIAMKNKSKNKIYFENPDKNEICGIVLKNRDNITAWSGENPPKIIGENKSEPDELTFESFFGGDFSWQRIRGNFVTYNYSIIHHILSQDSVYTLINQTGYYCLGFKETDNLKMIALAFPVAKNTKNPFDELNVGSYIIHMGRKEFYALCVGIDKTGEFFLTY